MFETLDDIVAIESLQEDVNMGLSTLVISIKEARKLLGKEANNYSDDRVEKLIIGLDCIALEYYKLVPSVIIDRGKNLRKGSK